MKKGTIEKISGPLVVAKVENPKIYELVYVGKEGLIGEVIRIKDNKAFIQVYEDTTGLEVNDVVVFTGKPLEVELGPGILGKIYDGLQRPLDLVEEFIPKGYKEKPLDRKKEWEFIPLVKEGKVKGGDIIGYVYENGFKHYILVPPNYKESEIKKVNEGKFTIEDIVIETKDYDLKLYHSWPIRKPRPYKKELEPTKPLHLKIRILDFLFPLLEGGIASIPGPFGSGKTVTLQTLMKNIDADVSIYIGCGERGNEMTDTLISLKKLIDPKTNRPLLERAILIANTSNMPVAAREASIYTGAAIAQYFRDMGYNAVLIADSLSRWAEAMREISGRLGELPAEEGFPGYLASKIASFYDKAKRVETLNGNKGSLTIIHSVSPPGGDFSEPVTQAVLRLTKVFWPLDKELANKRHFPAINWNLGFSRYINIIKEVYEDMGYKDYIELRNFIMKKLEEEEKLLDIVRIVGPEAIPLEGKITLLIGKLIREGFLQQDLFIERESPLEKTFTIARAIYKFYEYLMKKLKNKEIKNLEEFKEDVNLILKMRWVSLDECKKIYESLIKKWQ